MPNEIYGRQLALQLSEIEDRDALQDTDIIGAFLTELVGRIGMRVLAGPLVALVDGPPDKRGCSGVILLHESHAAIHTYSLLGQAFIDIFSCAEFEVSDSISLAAEFFGHYKNTEQTLSKRGRHWGGDIQSAMAAWANRHKP